MADFMNALKKNLDENTFTLTENGALAYTTTGSALVDLNFSACSDKEELEKKFLKAYAENPELAVKWLFYARDARGGLGMRKLFRDLFMILPKEVQDKVIEYVPEYGRYDDLIYIYFHDYNKAFDIIKNQLMEDLRNYSAGNPISLLAKWMPSNNTSSAEARKQAKILAHELRLTDRDYRKMLSKLRKYLRVTERDMSANKWNEIEYEKVPAKAFMNYRNAFDKHDHDRFDEFVSTGKVKSSNIYPFEIFSKVKDSAKEDPVLEQIWKNLPDADTGNTLVVADGSGSMKWINVFGSKATAWDVAHAMAFYFGERAKGCFKNKYITFSAIPELVSFDPNMTLNQKVRLAESYNDCSNTNIVKTFNLILSTAVGNHLPAKDMPKNILIISDMEFDECGSIPPFEAIKKRFSEYGYELPRLIFWNVGKNTKVPIQKNKNGITFVSGYSIAQCEAIIHGELDPYKNLVNILTSDRYSKIRL